MANIERLTAGRAAPPGELFYRPTLRAFARSTDPATAKQAAEAMTESELASLEDGILDTLRRASTSLTSREIAQRMHKDRDTISPRLRPMWKKNKIRPAAEKRMGKRQPVMAWELAI